MNFGKERTYLDWASAAPVAPAARRAFERALSAFGNPSSPHAEGRVAKEILEAARTTIARLAEVKPEAVIFTSGATEANNLAIQGLAIKRRWNAPSARLHALYLPSAHASIVDTMESLKAYGIEVEPLVIEDGAISLEALKHQLRSETFLVSMDAVCGETGTRWDTRGARRVMGAGALLHVDASQLPRTESFEQTRLAADLITLDAQKVGGVRGAGALIKKVSVELAPLTRGGGQEQGLRSGTEPVALIAAFAAALVSCAAERAAFAKRAEAMRARLIERLAKEFPDMLVNAGKEQAKGRVPHILNLSFPGRDTDYAVALMDEEGFALSTKSACETDSEAGSRAVLALTGDAARAACTLRISWGPSTKAPELNRAAAALTRTIRFLDTRLG